MIIEKEEFNLFKDLKVLKNLYAHQKFILNYDEKDPIKIHVPTSGGKTLSAVLFALRKKYISPSELVNCVLTYPTNLLSKNQFESSVVKGLTQWVGAKEIVRGIINPITNSIEEQSWNNISSLVGAPTIIFELHKRLGTSKLLVTVLTGEILFNMFNEENKIHLGEKKGTYLFRVLEKLMHYDHILITSPDLLGYVAQQCYSVSSGWYSKRWKDELSVKFLQSDIVIDEYHFYDHYTYINLKNTINRLNIRNLLLLSATKKDCYFSDVKEIIIPELEKKYYKDFVGTHIASYPIDVEVVESDLNVNESPKVSTIYFFNSVITAHEKANDLRSKSIDLIEWTGIEKSNQKFSKLIIATSAAEVGLDLPLQEMNTEFWGSDFEVSSLIQRIGRIGRFQSDLPFKAKIYINKNCKESYLVKKIFGQKNITKDQLTNKLFNSFGFPTFKEQDYVSFYLWDEQLKEQLKTKWQIIDSRVRFFFRPPQSQAVFVWNDHTFVYNRITIENNYNLEQTKLVTDLPFWSKFNIPEFEILSKKEQRDWKKPYTGKLGTPPSMSKKWFCYKEESTIQNII